MNTVSVDKKFLEHCLSVMRGVGELCQPIPRKSEDDPTEYCGGQALAELANCHNKLQETIAYAEQCCCENPDPSEGVALVSNCCPIHNANPYACDCFAEPAEQPEAGRDVCSRCHGVDGDCDALMSDDPTACPCRCHEPQAQEAVAEVVEVGGSLGELRIIRWIKGPLPVGAKLFAAPPTNAEAVRVVSALRSLWRTKDGALVLCNASVSTIEAACREADTFLRRAVLSD